MERRRFALLVTVVALALGAIGYPAGAVAGPPVGIAQSFPTHCDVETLAAGHEGNVWFTCLIETNYGYGSRMRVGRVTPAGKVTEFGRGSFPKNMEPGPIVAAANGDLWFPLDPLYLVLRGKRHPPVLARVTPSGTVTTYRPGLSSQYDIGDLVASPNGYLWFTAFREYGKGPSLWQVAPDGTIARLPIDLGETTTGQLEVGPEGDLWFTKKPASGPATGAIARLAPNGELTEFGAASAGFSPSTPLLAPDGDFWFFSNQASNVRIPIGVERIAPSGEITDTGAKLDVAGGIVGGATVGSDGNLWFGFQSGTLGQSAIERVTPSGEVSVFRNCLRYSQPFFGPDWVVTGADGNVWFTSVASRQLPGITDPPTIGRITPSGEITQIYAGVSLEPQSILAGPDGAIWFSSGIEEIQRVAPANGPINTFHVAPLRRAAANDAATARVVVPGPGQIELRPLTLLHHHRRVRLHGKTITATASACTTARLQVKPVGPALKLFRKSREAVERVAVTFTPTGGTPYTETAKLDFYSPRRSARGP
jgi:virginiamycin B lyase